MPFIRHIESEVPVRTVPHRSEVPLQDTWDLRLLYPTTPPGMRISRFCKPITERYPIFEEKLEKAR